MYRSGLVPRRMAWFGMIGGPLLLFANFGVLFDWWERTGPVSRSRHPGNHLGGVPRHLLRHLGIQARQSDPVRRAHADCPDRMTKSGCNNSHGRAVVAGTGVVRNAGAAAHRWAPISAQPCPLQPHRRRRGHQRPEITTALRGAPLQWSQRWFNDPPIGTINFDGGRPREIYVGNGEWQPLADQRH